MSMKLPLLVICVALATTAFAGGKPCPKGEVREYSCAAGTGPGSEGNKPCKKVWGKCAAKQPTPK